jgi:hypothetical protein
MSGASCGCRTPAALALRSGVRHVPWVRDPGHPHRKPGSRGACLAEAFRKQPGTHVHQVTATTVHPSPRVSWIRSRAPSALNASVAKVSVLPSSMLRATIVGELLAVNNHRPSASSGTLAPALRRRDRRRLASEPLPPTEPQRLHDPPPDFGDSVTPSRSRVNRPAFSSSTTQAGSAWPGTYTTGSPCSGCTACT